MQKRCVEFCSNLLQNYYTESGALIANARQRKSMRNDWKCVGAGVDNFFSGSTWILEPVEAYSICSNFVVKFCSNYYKANFTVKMMIIAKIFGIKS